MEREWFSIESVRKVWSISPSPLFCTLRLCGYVKLVGWLAAKYYEKNRQLPPIVYLLFSKNKFFCENSRGKGNDLNDL